MTNQSGAGGAATDAGVDFQQRLSAWFATAMLAHLDISSALSVANPLYVERISMQTADFVDDIVLTCEDNRKVFIQAKTSPVLSSDPGSDFGNAIKQFVAQHVSQPQSPAIYVLAVAPTASSRIRQQLRKLLLAVRYDADAWRLGPLSGLEKETLETFSSLVRRFSAELQCREWSEMELIEFARLTYIATFDMDDSGSDCRSAYILLNTISGFKAPADLLWSRLLQVCLDSSKRRLQISKKDLEVIMSRFIKDAEEKIHSKGFFEIQDIGNVPTGKEVVLLQKAEFGSDLLLFEMKRFDEHGQPRVKFTNGKCILTSGEYDLLSRTATLEGMQRILERNASKYSDRTLKIVSAKFDTDPELGNAAKARAEWIKNKLQKFSHELSCLYCGRPISASRSTLVEVDDLEHASDAGIVHELCVQPMHRILGEMSHPFFETYKHLIDFDVKLWAERLRRGQGMLAGVSEYPNPQELRIAWNPAPFESNLRYCIRFLLANGARPPALRRGKVQRFSLNRAKIELARGEKLMKAAARAGDPFCMTEDGRVFGPCSKLAEGFPHENVSECLSAEIVPYSLEIAEMYDLNRSFYAPLISIRVGDNEEYLTIEHACVLLSDVSRVEEHFVNWASAGIIIPDYYLEIIADDESFDTLMRENLAAGNIAVIDPILSADGTVISGIPIVPLPGLSADE